MAGSFGGGIHRVLVASLVALAIGLARAQAPPAEVPPSGSPPAQPWSGSTVGVDVVLDEEPLFRLYGSLGSFSPAERAQAVERRLVAIASNPDFRVADIQVQESEGASNIMIGNRAIAGILDADARAVERDRASLARDCADRIRGAIVEYRRSRSSGAIVRGVAVALGATVAFVGLLLLMAWLQRRIAKALQGRRNRDRRQIRILKTFELPRGWIVRIVLWLVGAARVALALMLAYTYLAIVFAQFPGTSRFGNRLLGHVVGEIQRFWTAFLDYSPNLLTIALIGVVTHYILKALYTVAHEVENGRLPLGAIDRDLAMPTFKIVRFFALALAAVAIIPYIPGSGSSAFQGVSVFIGLMFSLGSTGAIGNMVAGLILTYMRPFRVGDRVEILGNVGDVIERSLLVTRLRTIKNEEVTLPNSSVLGTHIVNYSAHPKDQGVLLHSTVTIGYDAPWRKVHEVLIEAAKASSDILETPSPFVLQTALNDFYVSYEINAATSRPDRMAAIYSELHQNIQDKFNEAGIEILSPHYAAQRDGNETTIPTDYRTADYRAPAFRHEWAGPPATPGVER